MTTPREDAYALLALLEALRRAQAPLPPPAALDPAVSIPAADLPPLPPTAPRTGGRRG